LSDPVIYRNFPFAKHRKLEQSGQTGQTHYNYEYSYFPSSSSINAVMDMFTINQDTGWHGGINDDLYYIFGFWFGPTFGSFTGAIPLELDLIVQHNSGVASLSWLAAYNITQTQHIFNAVPTVGHTYKREIINTGGTVTWKLTDVTAGTATETFTHAAPSGTKMVQCFNGPEWWAFGTNAGGTGTAGPFPLQYDVSINNWAYSTRGGV